MRNEKRYQDIDEILAAGIDVISTVNVQHLESLNDAIFELTDVRVRETFPDHVLDEADEVVLVDLTPEALQQRLEAGKVYPQERAERRAARTSSGSTTSAALRELALREVAEDVEARRKIAVLDPLSQQAVAERVLALIEPQPKSQRILRRAWRSSQRLGSEIDALWVRSPGREPTAEESTQLAALRRLAGVLGIHFLEEEGDDLVEAVRRVADERGSTYVFVGTPDESRRREIFGGSLLSRMVRELPGIDIRVVANRADRVERREPSDRGRRRSRRARRRARRGARATAAARRERCARRATRAGSSCPSPAAASTRPSSRAAIRIARADDAVLVPAYLLRRAARVRRGLAAAAKRSRSRCRCSRRSSTPPFAAASPSTRASRRAARRPTPSAASGRSSTSTGSSRRRRPTGGDDGGFTPKDLTWILTHAPTETLVLKPAPADETGSSPSPSRRWTPALN